jgi:hypothetical protein
LFLLLLETGSTFLPQCQTARALPPVPLNETTD